MPRRKGIDLERGEFTLGDLKVPTNLTEYLSDPSNSILYDLVVGTPDIDLDAGGKIISYSTPITIRLRESVEIAAIIKQRILSGFNQA